MSDTAKKKGLFISYERKRIRYSRNILITEYTDSGSQKTDNVNTSKTKKEVKSKDNEKNADKNKKISRHNTNAGSITFEFNRHTAGFIILIITFGVILFWGFNNTESLRGLVSYVFGLFSPLIIGCCMALYLMFRCGL